MQTAVDKFGRVIIPKTIRDRLGWKPGTILEIEEADDTLVLKVLNNEPRLMGENGFLVFTGKPL